jgi:hypothetical protein
MNLCAPYSELFSTKEIECETAQVESWILPLHRDPGMHPPSQRHHECWNKNKNNTTIIRNTQTARNINVIVDCREKHHKYLLESLQSRMMISDYLTTECKSLMGMKTIQHSICSSWNPYVRRA